MTTDEVFRHLQTLGFVPCAGAVETLERKLGPITLRASLAWPEDRVALHGSYRDGRQMADTQGMLTESVFSMLVNPTGLLPPDPSRNDIADRIEAILAELPELPALRQMRLAIQDDRVDEARALISASPASVTLKLGPNRGSMLHFARSAAMVQMLAESGVDPNQPARSGGRTPIFESTDPGVLDALFAAGANAEARDHAGRTALHSCVELSAVECLLNAGVPVNAVSVPRTTPLRRRSFCAELRWPMLW